MFPARGRMDELQKGEHRSGSDFTMEIQDRSGFSSGNISGPSDNVFDEKNAFLVVLDPEGKILSANRFFAFAMGCSQEGLKGVRFSERFLVPEDVAAFEKYVYSASRTLIPQKFTITFLLKKGNRAMVTCSLVSLMGKNWNVESLVLFGVKSNGGKTPPETE